MEALLDKPVLMAFIATIGTWALTAAGAALVFFFKRIEQHVLNMMLGFASGVMIAASFWSLLAPAIEMATSSSTIPAYLVASFGFLGGAAFLWLADQLLPHIHLDSHKGDKPEGIPTHLRRSVLLVLSITLHNFPEGGSGGSHSVPQHPAERCDRARCTCSRHRHRHPELSGRSGGLYSAEKGGLSTVAEAFLYGQASAS